MSKKVCPRLRELALAARTRDHATYTLFWPTLYNRGQRTPAGQSEGNGEMKEQRERAKATARPRMDRGNY